MVLVNTDLLCLFHKKYHRIHYLLLNAKLMKQAEEKLEEKQAQIRKSWNYV